MRLKYYFKRTISKCSLHILSFQMKELFLILIAVPAISMQCLSEDDAAVNTNHHSRNQLYRGQQLFTLNMLKQVNEMQPTENVFFSPFSVYNALLLAYFASANQTEASLKKTLALPENEVNSISWDQLSFKTCAF